MNHQLLTGFYTEISSTHSADNAAVFSSTIRLNAEHEIYKGHFPQVPVAPGVVLVQIIKEILMDKFQKELRLTEGDNIKFLALINPKEITDFQIDFSVKQVDGSIETSASYMNNGKSFTKFKGRFRIVGY
jgi:3-hydroxyacyl-[acyl-carrier-protein] dehydratase